MHHLSMDGVLDYSLLFRSVPGLLLVLSPDLRIVEASDAYLLATMREREEIVGRPLFEVYPDDPDDPAATGVHNLRESLERVLRDRAPHVMTVQKYSVRRPASDGGGFEERYWSPVNVPVFACDGDGDRDGNGDGKGEGERSLRWIIHRVEDVTTVVKSSYERERRQMVERIVDAQEEERRRLSRDLHDQMAQHLSALVLGVRALRPHCGDDEAHARLDHLEALAERLGREALELAMSLRPVLLDDFGLEIAIREQVERWSASTGIHVRLHSSGMEELRLPFSIETAVYRIVVEALTNVARHAQARHVDVVLDHHDSILSAIVEDDGIGFDVDTALRFQDGSHGFGLSSMHERASLLGGTLLIDSSPSIGSTVIARIPTVGEASDAAREDGDGRDD